MKVHHKHDRCRISYVLMLGVTIANVIDTVPVPGIHNEYARRWLELSRKFQKRKQIKKLSRKIIEYISML